MTQKEVLAILKTGANVFLTGEPGSGKTHTINEYVGWLRGRGIEPAVTASTGIAATHIGGRTIHSWSGIGVRRSLSRYDIDAISQNPRVAERVEEARVLIIDEVSMLSAQMLTMVDAVCREIRRSSRPFGGLQTVLVGDFFQLPPVCRDEQEQNPEREMFGTSAGTRFAFGSAVWSALKLFVCYLSEQHRQEDGAFLEFLSAIRRGAVSENHRVLLRTRYSREPKGGITQLYSHNEDVDRINAEKLGKLSGDGREFVMESHGSERIVAALKRGCLSPEKLELKIGARVMFTRNDIIRQRYVNGTLGEIIGFDKETDFPIVKIVSGRRILAEPDEWRLEEGGRVLARVIQIPLRLAWAITVHKSQGISLDAAHMDLSETFEYGQGYVALSRVRTLSGLSLSGLNEKALLVHPEIQKKDAEFRKFSQDAREALEAMSADELAAMHRNFIRACGGDPDARAGAVRKTKPRQEKVSTYEKTRALLLQKLLPADIAAKREMTVETIVSHLEKLRAEKMVDPVADFAHIKLKDDKNTVLIRQAIEKVGAERLKPIFDHLGGKIPYETIRLVRLLLVDD
ncbi:MAG: hypothetical protein A3G59_00535 [Candidatus Taylorbacteria bacterium RIFCSPLOWO2_12_FULL_47_20]|uniref:AAA+ ATPase domain-containing protein n=2 Tax=Candidatus Tayloriibacteriota TaxID=1817919 RepID=A0A1G2P4F8_9BACT|nr:MAG: hypothetical protein A3H68_01930 [Candidatus Taylorbacteria bacterium RIFCSPLOWO2_02_FULL_46_40]OHA43228.1 MAG: hypothetical protein A3G59_00535 [Candidatus Taylorbacteria bacterium RIFCSPLOWO2_12_FULL_47_20]